MSEVTYWYGHGLSILIPAFYYSLAAYIFLWTIQKFNVQNFPGLFLSAAVYGFLVEGVIANVIYEDGLFGITIFAFTSLSGHALVSAVLGWFYFRKLMLEKRILSLSVWSLLYGLFWGMWAPVFWLEESTDFAVTGVLPIEKFILYAFFITSFFVLSHWLISKVWDPPFKFHWLLNIIILGWAIFAFIPTVLVYPFAPIKLFVLLGIVFSVLWMYKKRQKTETNLFHILKGNIPFYRTLPLFLMPIIASIVYGIALYINLDFVFIEEVLVPMVVLPQIAVGWILFTGALIMAFFVNRPISFKVRNSR